MDTDLSQFISAVQRLQQGVHVAGGSLVLETHVACVLPWIPATWRRERKEQERRRREEGGGRREGKEIKWEDRMHSWCARGLQNTWLSACVHILDPVWGISFNMGLQYYGIILDKSLLLHVLESHEVTVPPVILPGTEAVVDVCSESRESTTNQYIRKSFYNTRWTRICLRKSSPCHVQKAKYLNF